MKDSTWESPGLFYIITIDDTTKFGITTNWPRRKEKYIRDNRSASIKIEYFDFWDEYWQTEFIESIIRRRLKPWVLENSHEYVSKDMPLECVIACYEQTKEFLLQNNELEYAESFHLYGNDRYGYYEQYFDMVREKLDS